MLEEGGGDCKRVPCVTCGYVFCRCLKEGVNVVEYFFRDCLQGAHIGECLLACGASGEGPEHPRYNDKSVLQWGSISFSAAWSQQTPGL